MDAKLSALAQLSELLERSEVITKMFSTGLPTFVPLIPGAFPSLLFDNNEVGSQDPNTVRRWQAKVLLVGSPSWYDPMD